MISVNQPEDKIGKIRAGSSEQKSEEKDAEISYTGGEANLESQKSQNNCEFK